MAKYGRFRLLIENILYKVGVDSLSGNVKYFAELNTNKIFLVDSKGITSKNPKPKIAKT